MRFLVVIALGVPAAFALLTVGGKPKLAPFNPDPSTLSPRQENIALYTGVLAARTINGTLKGYLSSTFNEDGLYRITSNVSQALSVALSASSVTGVFSADIIPSDRYYPSLGGITGRGNKYDENNFNPGSFNFAFLGGVQKDAAPGPANLGYNTHQAFTEWEGTTESAMWNFDTATSVLSPRWINSDEFAPTTYLLSVRDFFLITGDVAAYTTKFYPGTVVSFVLV